MGWMEIELEKGRIDRIKNRSLNPNPGSRNSNSSGIYYYYYLYKGLYIGRIYNIIERDVHLVGQRLYVVSSMFLALAFFVPRSYLSSYYFLLEEFVLNTALALEQGL
jgi:hypothetical protein